MRVTAIALTALLAVVAVPADTAPGWTTVDYSAIVDRRQPTHSGEPIGILLDRLDGRPVPSGAQRPGDRLAHTLLDPWLEPYAFVMPDAVDSLGGRPGRPWIEVAGLWAEGESQPAWVELLRSRRYVLESDGGGRLRAFVPAAVEDLGATSRDAARRAWTDAWPVMRHAVAAERRRLPAGVGIEIVVHPFVHRPARTRFELGMDPWTVSIAEGVPGVSAAPLALDTWQAFLDSGLRLEGARLAQDGGVRLFGSPVDEVPRIAGRPTSLADLAVAYRAVFHGGMAEPYMSLDRGWIPSTSVVNYGGRLRDTGLGEVALRADVRFKTFSLGLDAARRVDDRERIREVLPGFRTHLERFAADPSTMAVRTQQTRLWFYPDRVDLTVSQQGDVLALRNVRLSAASERLDAAGAAASGEEPPWTAATVAAINRDYDALAGLYPELSELDQCVRLLSLFTWLRYARSLGLPVPDLDGFLAVELPEHYTPRRFPQLLTYNALPRPDGAGHVVVLDRLAVGDILERIDPSSGPEPMPARERFDRAVADLDTSDADHRALALELARVDPDGLDDISLDALAYRAERLTMHRMVLRGLPPEQRERLRAGVESGELVRAFSVAIGGLDLGMNAAIRRGTSRSTRLGTTAGPAPAVTTAAPPTSVTPSEPAGVVAVTPAGATMPGHGPDRSWTGGFSESMRRDDGTVVERVVHDPDGPAVRTREVRYPGTGGAPGFRRIEGGRRWDYGIVAGRGGMRAAPARGTRVTRVAAPAVAPLGGTAVMALGRRDPGSEAAVTALRVVMRLPDGRDLAARHDGASLRRVVGGPGAMVGASAVPGLVPAPDPLTGIARVVIPVHPERMLPPWRRPPGALAPEEDAIAVARGLRDWYRTTDPPGPAIAVGATVDAAARWEGAPTPDRKAVLVISGDGRHAGRDAGWNPARVVDRLPARKVPSLVVVASDEPPAILARRLRRLARDPRMEGRLLAVYALAGPVRADLPAGLLAEGLLAGVGIAEFSPVDGPVATRELAALGAALADTGRDTRVEDLPGSVLWYF